MALHSLYCADVPLRNCSLTHTEVLGAAAAVAGEWDDDTAECCHVACVSACVTDVYLRVVLGLEEARAAFIDWLLVLAAHWRAVCSVKQRLGVT